MSNPFKILFGWLESAWQWANKEIPVAKKIFAVALPVIQEIIALVPKDALGNRSLDDVLAAYQKYAVPVADWIMHLPADGLGKALMELVTILIQRQFPSVSTMVIQSGIQLAVVEASAMVKAS